MPNDVDLELLTVVIVIVGIAIAMINFGGLSINILNGNVKYLEFLLISAMTLSLHFMSKLFGILISETKLSTLFRPQIL